MNAVATHFVVAGYYPQPMSAKTVIQWDGYHDASYSEDESNCMTLSHKSLGMKYYDKIQDGAVLSAAAAAAAAANTTTTPTILLPGIIIVRPSLLTHSDGHLHT